MRLLKRTIKMFLFLCVVGIITIIGLYVYAYYSPKLDIKNANQFYIYDDKENLVYQGSGNNEWISLENISDDLINAVLSTEDKNFYKHHGFDYFRIIKAILNNANKVGVGTIEDVDYRVKTINRFWGLKISEFPLEKAQLFNYFFGDLFEDYEDYDFYEYKSFNIYSCLNGRVVIYKLIALDLDGKNYYYMDDGKVFKRYTSKELRLEFRNRNVRISDYVDIPGLYGIEFHKVK